MRIVDAALVLWLVGCGGAPIPAGIPDVEDRCPVLPPECLVGFDFVDTDGCPDAMAPRVAFTHGSASIDAAASRVIDDVAHDAAHLAQGARLRLVAVSETDDDPSIAAARVEAVRTALTTRGVRAALVDSGGEVDPRYVGEPHAGAAVRITVDGCAF